MNRIFPILFILVSVITSCDNNKDPKKKDESKIDSAGIESRKTAIEKSERTMEELEKLTPMTEEQLKGLMPETLMETPLSNYSFNDGMGASLVSGEYKINDSTDLSINIYDCAGAGGAGLYNLQFAGQLDYTTDNPNEYTRVIDFNGGKAIEHCMKAKVECSLTYFSGGRFLVIMEGNSLTADQLKQLAKNIKIK